MRPKISKDGNAVTIEFDDDRQARDYAALATDDAIRQAGTRSEKAEKAVQGLFDGLDRTLTRFAEGATGTVGIVLLGLALGYLAWHSWDGWWEPMGLRPLSIIGPVLVLAIIGLSVMIAQSRLEELQAVRAEDAEREADEQAEQQAYRFIRWAAVAANAVAAISFQATLITDADTGRGAALARLNDLRIERRDLVDAMAALDEEAFAKGRLAVSAQSSARLERDIERMYSSTPRNQLNEPIKGKTVRDLVGDCSHPLPNWQTYFEVYCPAINDRKDELDAVRDYESKAARVAAIDAETDALVIPPASGLASQMKGITGDWTGIVMAGLIAAVFACFEFLLGKLTYHWRLTKLKREHLK